MVFEHCRVISFFSEENVWKLCEQIKEEKEQSLNEYYAVFISNDKRQVCFFKYSGTQLKYTYHFIWPLFHYRYFDLFQQNAHKFCYIIN